MADPALIAAIAAAVASVGEKRPRVQDDLPITRAEFNALAGQVQSIREELTRTTNQFSKLQAPGRTEPAALPEAQTNDNAHLSIKAHVLALICGGGHNTLRAALAATNQQIAVDLATPSPELDAILTQIGCTHSQWAEVIGNRSFVAQGERAVKNFKARVYTRATSVDDPFEDKSAQQILTELPVLRVNVGTTAAGFAVRCATIGVASKQAALQHASLRSIAFAALGRSEAMRNFVTARKQAKTQAASSATHAAKLARWDKLVDSVIACVQHGIDTALPRILERAAAV